LVNEAYKSGIVKTVESKLGDKYFLFYVTPVEGGGYVNIYGLDVTSRKLAELELAKISVAIEQSINVIFITDVQGKIDYVNKRFEDVTGYSRDEIIGQTPRVFSSGETPDSVYKDMWSIILSGKTWRGTFKNKKKSGEEYWVNGLIFPVKGADEDIANFLAIQEDITEKMFSEERMSFLKAHDELTGLFNRSKLEKSISHWLDTEKDNKASFIHMDIDNFKFVNDVKGHKSGDEVLKDLADLLRDFINKYDKAPLGELRDQVVISRLGGDEMGLFLPEVSKGDAVKLAEEIRLRVSNEIKFEGDNDLTVSMGVVAYPMQCDSIEQMLIRADAAKYRAKELGQDRVHLYSVDDKVLEDMHSRLNWRTKITDGIEEGRFIPWFQPIMDLKTGKVTHYEALARMLDDNGEVLLPGAFIDVAERFGYIGQIDREITGKVMAVQKETSDSGSPITFSVNLSGKLLNDHGTLDYLRAKIEETGANPKNLVFEITETAAVSDLKVAATFVSELKTLGCKFSLDDFGVGFTSFVYLRELDVDYIKIDGSFIRVIEESENDRLFVKAITDVAKGLGVKTIAEFVGSQEAIDILKDIGVDYVQGYYIGKPAEKLLERE
ncbi:MAG: EAL domain-containing protein, partial [Deltaproteobacteria bacterium]|nr:EAL domain-containing protein [Deltaproteobacteria bacterium]